MIKWKCWINDTEPNSIYRTAMFSVFIEANRREVMASTWQESQMLYDSEGVLKRRFEGMKRCTTRPIEKQEIWFSKHTIDSLLRQWLRSKDWEKSSISGQPIDFHGLQVREVDEYMKLIMNYINQTKKRYRVTIITGSGNHSYDIMQSVNLDVTTSLRFAIVSSVFFRAIAWSSTWMVVKSFFPSSVFDSKTNSIPYYIRNINC